MSPQGPADLPKELLRALEAARGRYRAFPGVLGIAAGYKFRRGRRAGAPAVQFFVERKLKRPARRLPRFVFGRDRRGRVLRSSRFPTDVIPVRPPRFACGAGGVLRAPGERGTIALLFRDKAAAPGAVAGAGAGAAGFFLLTCAHVAGDLVRSPPASPRLRADARPGADPFAVVVKNSVAAGELVEYDLALARLDPAALPVPELAIEGGGRITGWLEPQDLVLGLDLWIATASGRRRGLLESLAGEFQVVLDGRTYRVQNLFGLSAAARPGDSGGLVHRRGKAAGLVVARSPGGYAWWQPLKPALDHLNRARPRTAVAPF